MATYEVGKLLRLLRKQRGVSQEELCLGICSQKTLSRVENDKHNLNKVLLESLMQRLGVNAENYFSEFISAADFKLFKLKKQISDFAFEGKYKESKSYFNEILNDERFSEGLNRQFYLYYESVFKLFMEKLSDKQNYEVLKILNEALIISIPEFKEKEISNYLLTSREIEILNCIAIVYKRVNRLQDAIELMYRLKECIEKTKIDFDEKAKTYILTLYNLSNYLGQSGKHEEAIELCDLAIDACIKSNKYHYFAHVIFNKAYALNLLGDTEPCKRMLFQAYYIFDATMNYKNAKIVKDYAKKEHGITF